MSNPHANCRAEIGVKTVKRALAGNTPDNGDLNTDAFQKAMLAYRNTPDPVTKISPAIAIFARPIQDLLPVLPGKLRLHDYWDASWTTERRRWLIVDPGNTTSGPNTLAPSPLSWLETRSGCKTSRVYSPVDGTNSASSLRLNSSTNTGFACSDQAVPPYGTENSSTSAPHPLPLWSPHFRMSVLLRYIPLCPTK